MAADEKPGWKSWLRSAFRSDIGRVKGWLRSAFCSGFARVKGWLCSPAFWSGVILVVVVCAISYKYESIKSYVPWLITLQLKTYNLISGARQSSLRPVVAVEIDDDTFYGYMGNESPYDVTDRSALAELVRIATRYQTPPNVIALDINLDKSPTVDDAEKIKAGNCKLDAAINAAVKDNIPVVLVFGFQNAKDGGPVPAWFLQTEKLSLREGWEQDPRGGFDHAPDDRRKVPLEVGRNGRYYPSFALQIVDAFENAKEREKLVPEGEFVYTNYLNQCQFPHVSAADLLCQSPNPEAAGCASLEHYRKKPDSGNASSDGEQRCPKLSAAVAKNPFKELGKEQGILLIGGNRHRYPDGGGGWLDTHDSPAGDMRGMYFQANYVEGLLDFDNRIRLTVPPLRAALIDATLAIALLLVLEFLFDSEAKVHWSRKYGALMAVFVVPIVLAWVLPHVPWLGKRRYALDFVLPLVLLCLHPALERYIKLFISYIVGPPIEGVIGIVRRDSPEG